MAYEAPSITELGSVADFTRADLFSSGSDGFLWFGKSSHDTPTS